MVPIYWKQQNRQLKSKHRNLRGWAMATLIQRIARSTKLLNPHPLKSTGTSGHETHHFNFKTANSSKLTKDQLGPLSQQNASVKARTKNVHAKA